MITNNRMPIARKRTEVAAEPWTFGLPINTAIAPNSTRSINAQVSTNARMERDRMANKPKAVKSMEPVSLSK